MYMILHPTDLVQVSVDSFKTRDENHPLHKPMVDHDQDRVKARGEREIHDHIA